MALLANIIVAFVPVLVFLAVLVVMDSFKLARPSAIAAALGWGVVAAVLSGVAQLWMTGALSGSVFHRVVAPAIEEAAKCAFIAYLILKRRIGFPVDAAQLGFAVGTGFALVENLEYLRVLSGAGFVLWLVRGLGTAMLHGATTAIFAMLAQTAADRHRERGALIFLPGLVAAVVIHTAFNILPVSPLATTAMLLLVLPLLVLWVFQRSEMATREWVGAGLDLDLMLHETFSSEALAYTKFGAYLRELRQRFPGHVVADMLCLLRVELELSIQAKAMLIARDAGMVMSVHPDARSATDEIRHLRSSIGTTGLLALNPVQVTSHRDDWHRYLLVGNDSARMRWLRRLQFWKA
ncbi:MAG TPA: PrsW family glutamic-type intramembrane protease [Vicinamibacterales bacterium]|jgi:RsiW-degrading membrane proteinase PrsW (M82 family)|nr:PrsW family glutamic-type intramembrane protease [Vicinamibacterales bacterium]